MNRLKIIAVVYLVKTLLVGIAWLVVPDLPQRAMTKAREIFNLRGGTHASPAVGVRDPP